MVVSREVFKQYYATQMGGGGGGMAAFGPVYRSSFQIQRGRGIGGWLRGLWTMLKPSLLGGARKAGEQLLASSGRLIADYADPENREDAVRVLKSRAKEGWGELKQRLQRGTGRARGAQVGRGLRPAGPSRQKRVGRPGGRTLPKVTQGRRRRAATAPAARRRKTRQRRPAAAAADVL